MCSMKTMITWIIALGLIGAIAYFVMQSDMMKKAVVTEQVEVIDVATNIDAASAEDVIENISDVFEATYSSDIAGDIENEIAA